jgi:hypothetical protein
MTVATAEGGGTRAGAKAGAQPAETISTGRMGAQRITDRTTIFRRSKPVRPTLKSMQYQDRYVPAETNGGWPFAFGIILLAVICIASATMIHKKTYKHPTDPTWHAKGQRAAEPAAGH